MIDSVRVNVLSGDTTVSVRRECYRALAAARPGPGSIKGRDVAVAIPDKAVVHPVAIDVLSRNLISGVDTLGYRTLSGARTRARNIKGGQRPMCRT